VEVSYRTIGSHLWSVGYVKKNPSKAAPMLTEAYKQDI